MILAVDIGNTTIEYCFISSRGSDYDVCFRYKVKNLKSTCVDDYITDIRNGISDCLEDINTIKKKISLIGISSVVPDITYIVGSALERVFDIIPVVINSELNLGIDVLVDEPYRVGIDRLCDAAYAAGRFDGAVITADLGTATTINVINEEKQFLGGTIMPGLMTGFRALTSNAAQLSDIKLSTPEKFIGKNTADCMNIGTVMGMAGAIDGIVGKIEEQLGKEAALILTGGCSEIVSSLVSHEHYVDKNLLAKGIAYILEKNR